MESTASVLDRASSAAARAAAEAGHLSSIHLVWVAGLVVRALERCAFLDRARELQEAIDVLAGADLQTMANAAGMVSSAAARAALEAEIQEEGLADTCRNLEVAARELSLAVAVAAAADSKAREESTCQWAYWIKKDRRNADELDDGVLRQALLQHKAWPSSKKASTVLAGAPEPEENLGEFLGYPLFGSLTLLPYLDPAGVALKNLKGNGPTILHFVFSVVWMAVSLGVPCRQCRDTALMQIFADVASCIGMAGITALVIWYSCLLIAPGTSIVSYIIMAVAYLLHFFAWAWVRRWIRWGA
ncbi:uncharacterized protein LOC119279911 [Triticum dicoccoides]|uniref:uncharacterized protein LOC119279911 n=1 Tax=Triticum dicoccoides TaxID=85692 RepID=UPI00188DE54C|nr:uncharacterized protein LOC119279911 [Triticum dicoccoides]XP_044345325.1 uncharacterized protein LOC123066276 [Triticum aestivum]